MNKASKFFKKIEKTPEMAAFAAPKRISFEDKSLEDEKAVVPVPKVLRSKPDFTKILFSIVNFPLKVIIRLTLFIRLHYLTKAGLSATWFVLKYTVWRFISFSVLLSLYLINALIIRFPSWWIIPRFISSRIQQPWAKLYSKISWVLDREQRGSLSRSDLIELSIRSMLTKRVRSIITVGGMAIGIGAIVFLVSIGYGLQQLVIARVARLEEMKQTDVLTQTGGRIKMNDRSLNDYKEISNVKSVLPLIAVVGRINYQDSVTDVAVYGVTADYLKQSDIKPIQGKIFDNNQLSAEVPHTFEPGEVAGVSSEASGNAEIGDVIGPVDYAINPKVWVRVREKPQTNAKIIGYTKRSDGTNSGEEVWGGYYAEDKTQDSKEKPLLSKWIKSSVLVWSQKNCDKAELDCADGRFVVARESDGSQKQVGGYFAEVNISLPNLATGSSVLGVTSDSTNVASGSGSIGFVDIASESGTIALTSAKTVSLSPSAIRQAVINRGMLKLLGLKESDVLNKVFLASFVVTGDLLGDSKVRVESTPAEYTIIGVIPDEKTPVMYVPFLDLRSLGVTNYSQVKVGVNSQNDLPVVRRKIEALGYVTRSVADTVAQINSLFSTARTLLALLGMVALAVAALGMFNTLTVSLLERTREVGLMKALGMKSSEVQELFLTESMIIAFFGGILGLLFGFLAGKGIGLILSFFSLFRGAGFIDISYIPFPFVCLILFLSLIVGVVTGIYPARRATKISALNALRYE